MHKIRGHLRDLPVPAEAENAKPALCGTVSAVQAAEMPGGGGAQERGQLVPHKVTVHQKV